MNSNGHVLKDNLKCLNQYVWHFDLNELVIHARKTIFRSILFWNLPGIDQYRSLYWQLWKSLTQLWIKLFHQETRFEIFVSIEATSETMDLNQDRFDHENNTSLGIRHGHKVRTLIRFKSGWLYEASYWCFNWCVSCDSLKNNFYFNLYSNSSW